ncbi:MAG: SDR family NAD(P)-dependent oxidoreductase, partial [Alistipes sp.]|nr:SDR family NAD(P)-dependent oxidoreductase [Alistipes sp.]
TSVMGLRGSRSAPAYAASKAYQINYLEGLRQKAFRLKSGVRVIDIRPGSVDTAMMKGEGHFWITSPEDAAKMILGAVERGRGVRYVSPRWGSVAALLKLLPRGLYKRM